MKVLQINSVCGIGSTGRIATDIHNILIEQGHESHIAYGRDLPKNCENTIRIGTKLDNYTHVLKTRVLDKHGYGSARATIKFIDEVKELDPDIIHLHNLHGYYINIEILFDYLKKANKPVVWTLHDCWPFTGHGAYLDKSENLKGTDMFVYGTDKKSYPQSLLLSNAKGNYNSKKKIFTGVKDLTVVSPSEWLANLVRESFLNEYPVKVINNGIDLNTFRPNVGNFRKKFNLNSKFIILGVASVWDRRKGLKYFVELANKLSEDEVIILVGLTKKQMKQIPENIIGITKTNNIEELVDIYSSADVFINPTLEDNFPTTNLEALACGTPVITFDTGGSPESVNENTGFVVEKEDVDDLNYKIESLSKKSNGEIQEISESARRRVETKFNKYDKFREYVEQYKSIK